MQLIMNILKTRQGETRHGASRRGTARYGMAGNQESRQGNKDIENAAGRGQFWPGKSGHGEAWLGMKSK
jgi:hypothetical protein